MTDGPRELGSMRQITPAMRRSWEAADRRSRRNSALVRLGIVIALIVAICWALSQ